MPCPLYFLTDERGERIEDCIALALGGNDNYDRTLAGHQDAALFMTPMWASNWKSMGQEEAASGKRRDLRSMIKSSGMKKVAQINTGLCFEPGFMELVDEFVREFGLQKIELPGKEGLAKGSYERAKKNLLPSKCRRKPPSALIRSPHPKGIQGLLQAVCRMTRKKFLEE